ncbi:MAG: DUF4234 domain-containing protein, partial [Erysipelotrichaceae bacterium]
MICSRCGNEVSEGTKYCPNCGNRMSGDHDALSIIIKIVAVFAGFTLGITAIFSLLNLILLFTNYTHGLFHLRTSLSVIGCLLNTAVFGILSVLYLLYGLKRNSGNTKGLLSMIVVFTALNVLGQLLSKLFIYHEFIYSPVIYLLIIFALTMALGYRFDYRSIDEIADDMKYSFDDAINGVHFKSSYSYSYNDGQLKADRSIWLYILFNILTCGIYGLYFVYDLARDVNIICSDDGESTPGLIVYILLCILTCGIYNIYWQ